MGMDCHAWAEDDAGNIYDYPEDNLRRESRNLLKSMPKGKGRPCVRQPYTGELEKKVKAFIADWWTDGERELVDTLDPDSPDFPPLKCYIRAYILANKKGYKLKIGSLGWRQKDGKVFWDYG